MPCFAKTLKLDHPNRRKRCFFPRKYGFFFFSHFEISMVFFLMNLDTPVRGYWSTSGRIAGTSSFLVVLALVLPVERLCEGL